MNFSTWFAFFLATVAISLSPGPGAIAAMGAGLHHGFRHGRWIALGLALGVITQLLVVGVGLGALLATSEAAFALVKWLGAAYLVWLGVQQWRSPASPISAPAAGGQASGGARTNAQGAPTHPVRALLLRGWTVNALNPKGTVFLLAVMPQFLSATEPLLAQYSVIAATFGTVEFCVMTGYVALAARVLGLLRSPSHIRWMNRSFGGLFVLAGVVLAGFKRAP